jgi:hypothetical protein
LCRGYEKAVCVLEEAMEEEDAFIVGKDPRTGFTVAIGAYKASAELMKELYGDDVIWVSPDEVAAVMANLNALNIVIKINHIFPGAEISQCVPAFCRLG